MEAGNTAAHHSKGVEFGGAENGSVEDAIIWAFRFFSTSSSVSGQAPLDSVRHPRAKWPEGRATNPTSNFQSSDLSFISFAENPPAKPFLARKLLEAEH